MKNLSKEVILMPKNEMVNLDSNEKEKANNIHNINMDNLHKIKFKYKNFYKKLIQSNVITQTIKPIESNNLFESVNKKKINFRKNNSFFNKPSNIMEKDILFELDKLKFRIKLKRKNYQYSSYNKTPIFNKNDKNNKNKQTFNIYSTINSKNKNHLLTNESFGKFQKIIINSKYEKNKNIFQNKIKNNNLYKIKNNSNESKKKVKHDNYNNSNNEGFKTIFSYNFNNKMNKDIDNYDKEELIKENERLRKELEYSNNQLEKYKKYHGLYLNLLKNVNTNKNFTKNINTNNGNNNDYYLNNYINELIERDNEINQILNEDEILEKNIKEILSKLE